MGYPEGQLMPGTLYIVATPIGNLEDITYRAVRILQEADVIACEDTRQTQKLLQRYQIARPLVSYHDHNEAARTVDLLTRLEQGQNVALVSDAGTPLISDPGYRLVHAARERGLTVVPIPGASALLTALTAAGLPTDAFTFGGFLPVKTVARQRTLQDYGARSETLVFYEAPHRILAALEDIQAVLGARQVVLGRELTKAHEEFLTGTASQLHQTLVQRPAIKGEFTVVIGGSDGDIREDFDVVAEVRRLIAGGTSRMDAMKQVSKASGLPKREVYRQLEAAGDETDREPS